MEWQDVDTSSGNNGPIHKWTQVGQVAEGFFRGFRAGKYGPQSLMIIESAHGENAWSATATVLQSKLAKVSEGDYIRIEYLSKRRGQTGKEYQDFRVQRYKGRRPEPVQETPPRLSMEGEFDALVRLVAKEKGDGIAQTLATVAKATGDPIASLRAAMDQIGVVPF